MHTVAGRTPEQQMSGEFTMLKGAAAGALAVAFLATATTAVAAPNCKNKSSQYVACTDRLRSAPQQGRRAVVPQGSVKFRVDAPPPQAVSQGLSNAVMRRR